MKTVAIACFAVCWLLGSQGAWAAPTPVDSLIIEIFGSDGFGFAGAVVQLTGPNGNTSQDYGSVTDELGHASFPNLVEGDYQVTVQSATYPVATRTLSLPGSGTQTTLTVPLSTVSNTTTYPPKILSKVTYPYSSLGQNVPQYLPGTWPMLASLCSAQVMQDDAGSLSLGAVVYSPTRVTMSKLVCATNSDGELAPKLQFDYEMVNGDHTYDFQNGALVPQDVQRVTPPQTDTHPGDAPSTVYSADFVLGAPQDFYVELPTNDFVFEYQPTDCLQADGTPETDLMKVLMSDCAKSIYDNGGGQIEAFREDIMGTTPDASGNELTIVHYQARDAWLVLTLADSATPGGGSVFAQRTMLALSGKSGNPIWIKDRFSSSVDEILDSFSAPGQVFFASGKPATSRTYFRYSPQLLAALQALDYDGDTIPSYEVAPIGDRHRSDLGESFGRNDNSVATNNIWMWHGLPFPVSTLVTQTTEIFPMADNVQYQTASYNGAPAGELVQRLEELATNMPSLGAAQLTPAQVQAIMLEAASAPMPQN